MITHIINTENIYKNKYKEEIAELLISYAVFNGNSDLNILKVYDKSGSYYLILNDYEFKKNFEVHPNLISLSANEHENTLLNCSYLMEEYPNYEQLVADCTETRLSSMRHILNGNYGILYNSTYGVKQ